jgi:hypothetical protein
MYILELCNAYRNVTELNSTLPNVIYQPIRSGREICRWESQLRCLQVMSQPSGTAVPQVSACYTYAIHM